MTAEEAKANKADTDTSKATWDEATNKWMFFECVYEVTNTATFKIPITGGFGDWKYGIIGFGTLAVLGTGLILVETQRKKKAHRRKK